MGDNRIFNVNGEGDPMLLKAIELAFMQRGDNTTCVGFTSHPVNGMILCWHKEVGNDQNFSPLPRMSAVAMLPIVIAWLASDEAAKIPRLGQDAAYEDGDVHNHGGWRVYCEGWGHVAGLHAAICAVTPVSIWYGK